MLFSLKPKGIKVHQLPNNQNMLLDGQEVRDTLFLTNFEKQHYVEIASSGANDPMDYNPMEGQNGMSYAKLFAVNHALGLIWSNLEDDKDTYSGAKGEETALSINTDMRRDDQGRIFTGFMSSEKRSRNGLAAGDLDENGGVISIKNKDVYGFLYETAIIGRSILDKHIDYKGKNDLAFAGVPTHRYPVFPCPIATEVNHFPKYKIANGKRSLARGSIVDGTSSAFQWRGMPVNPDGVGGVFLQGLNDTYAIPGERELLCVFRENGVRTVAFFDATEERVLTMPEKKAESLFVPCTQDGRVLPSCEMMYAHARDVAKSVAEKDSERGSGFGVTERPPFGLAAD